MRLKILNLYSGIGGNRKNWSNRHDVTAVEFDPTIAAVYADLFPKDNVIVGDAHEYLLRNFQNFDFIWSSPPCQSHASFRQNICVRFRGTSPVFPDMRLYQEIIFLQHNFKGKWVVENVKPYYRPLIEPAAVLQRHCFWSNFPILADRFPSEQLRSAQIPELSKAHGYDLSSYRLDNKRQVLRNCVLPQIGSHILKNAMSHCG